MPVVPFSKSQPSETLGSSTSSSAGDPFALMAAAQMHSEGRLVQDQNAPGPEQELSGKYFGPLTKDDNTTDLERYSNFKDMLEKGKEKVDPKAKDFMKDFEEKFGVPPSAIDTGV